LLDKKTQERGYDDYFETHVYFEYASCADIITIKANNSEILMGFNEANELAIAFARFVKNYGGREALGKVTEIIGAHL
jgi:hypothetical protein